MPTFPTYHGDLPPCLNPLNLRHYFLLVYWIFFRPTALKCYLYQADVELYRGEKSGWNVFRVPACRNLVLMVPGTIMLLEILLGLVTSLLQILFILFLLVFGELSIEDMYLKFPDAALIYTSYKLLNMMLSVVFSVVWFGVMFGVLSSVVFGVVFSVVFGVANVGMAFGVVFGVAINVAFSFGMVLVREAIIPGGLRLYFYPPQWLLAKFYPNSLHPLMWDEWIVLPFPNSSSLLTSFLQQDEQKGICQLAEVTRNPFQRWAVQQALYEHLHQQEKPLHFFYRWFVFSELDAYVFAPIVKQNWENIPDRRQLLLGELGGEWGETNLIGEKAVWWLTKPLRHRQSTSLTQFARLLYALYKQKRESPLVTLNQPWAQAAYTQIEHYPGGLEISHSFALLRTFLNYQTVTDFALAPQKLKEATLPNLDTALRPAVLQALAQLGDIGAEVAVYQESTSRANKLAALARAAESLEQLKTWVTDQINVPEGYVLQTIITQWQPLITKAAGDIGQFTLSAPVPNPYVAGNPVKPPLFVGREDTLLRLEELWSRSEQSPSVVLYGHRRMGKTSILQNLGTGIRFGKQTYIVDFNMQRVGFVPSTGELLYNLAVACYDKLPASVQAVVKEPDLDTFTKQNPYHTFDRFLKQLDKHRQEWRLIVTIDEFELIETGIQEGRLEPHLLDFGRGLIHTYAWFILALAGLHTLEEKCHDYWHPLFGSVTQIPVSFLTAGAAHQLITQPHPDFPIDYDEAAITEIIRLTHGQPYLVQQICHSLVSRFNRQTFEEGMERERRFTLADVQAVITSSEFFRDGNAYFIGVWGQAEEPQPLVSSEAQPRILKTLAPLDLGMTKAELEAATQLSTQELEEALQVLKRHDVVYEEDGKWRYRVELMRWWVKDKK